MKWFLLITILWTEVHSQLQLKHPAEGKNPGLGESGAHLMDRNYLAEPGVRRFPQAAQYQRDQLESLDQRLKAFIQEKQHEERLKIQPAQVQTKQETALLHSSGRKDLAPNQSAREAQGNILQVDKIAEQVFQQRQAKRQQEESQIESGNKPQQDAIHRHTDLQQQQQQPQQLALANHVESNFRNAYQQQQLAMAKHHAESNIGNAFQQRQPAESNIGNAFQQQQPAGSNIGNVFQQQQPVQQTAFDDKHVVPSKYLVPTPRQFIAQNNPLVQPNGMQVSNMTENEPFQSNRLESNLAEPLQNIKVDNLPAAQPVLAREAVPMNPVENFVPGIMQKVNQEDGSKAFLNNPPQPHAFPPEQQVQEIGGMHINWDWDDFSITFDNYGAAEMKVRRAPHASTGEPWPLPQYYTKKDRNVFTVDRNMNFILNGNVTCDLITTAMKRYKIRITEFAIEDMYDNLQNAEGTNVEPAEMKYHTHMYQAAPTISTFSLKVRKPCTHFPTLNSDESYDLVIKKTSAYLWANEVWGLLRGLETLSQLIWLGSDGKLYVKESIVSDYPRFPHRGILLDTARHYILKDVILDMMDAMEMNKMNVLHWHIVDDQSFPYQSQVYPELSAKGAYHPTSVYSLTDIADIIEYGRQRGIRILPEFDTPGHTYSWGLSRPDLLTQCYSGSSAVKGYLGPINPVSNSSYTFLKSLFAEVMEVFKDEFIHLGGDEVPLSCWQSNPEVVSFGDKLSQQQQSRPTSDKTAQQNFFGPSPNIRLVYEYYVNRVMRDLRELGSQRENHIKFIMWQEVMNNDLKLPNDTLIQVWMGDMADVSRAISLGYNVLYSTCWYLDHVEYGVKWPKYYQCDPADTTYGYAIDEKKVRGGEACLWSEYIDNENLIQITWPRASAVAERLWSSKDTRNLDTAGERLSEHRCRMLGRGLSVSQVSGPDFCKRPVKLPNSRQTICKGSECKSSVAQREELESVHIRVKQRGSSITECAGLFGGGGGGHLSLVIIVLLIVLLLMLSVSRWSSNSKLYQLRSYRNRTILIVFLAVLFIYIMCYTTMWMQVFEFSGSFRKTTKS